MLTTMASPVRSRSGRPEFGRVYLRSLIASAEERVELHRSRGHRIRLRVATRRLRRLLAYENQRHVRIGSARSARPRIALALVSVVWVAALVALATLELRHASAVWVTAVELPMLALVVLWFVLAVACVPAGRSSPEEVTTAPR
jgi:hypothetical protein